ncbi:hypothetical protein L0668_09330 [Paraglaciecola aquimarina]|uniref:Glycine zipper 2TM domain-containing protein n=1 Tax=Paraglaciecola algarum TaxID=3050085 RepID=A0ABS9D605_9ALTE|nr:hypothetical protein [Paraglaciecola sp. G1-23]MCF2948306.1 hypothetical protein [Paraglaciecola sp. G1-23]
MNRLFSKLLILINVLVLGACANSAHVDHQAKNQFVTEFYALVEDVHKVKFKSYAGEAAAVGAVDGALSNIHGDSDDMLAGAIIGGIFGGLLTAIFEGDTTGYEYQLSAIDGDIVNVIVDDKEAHQGQCVKVRVAGDVRLSLRPMSQCDRAAREFEGFE